MFSSIQSHTRMEKPRSNAAPMAIRVTDGKSTARAKTRKKKAIASPFKRKNPRLIAEGWYLSG
jgi:hypothetical protein